MAAIATSSAGMGQGIHILGASGCGVTTLGRAVAQRLGWRYLDTDDFYWLPTDPPFVTKRAPAQRLERLCAALDEADRWVLGGALDGWGDPLIPRFDLVVFLEAPVQLRLSRLRAREAQVFGARIQPGGDMAEHHARFIEWAAGYDDSTVEESRNRRLHEWWLATLPCPVLRLDASAPLDELVDRVIAAR